jgi:hypothetical protein
MEMVPINGLMKGNLPDIMLTISCKGLASLPGKMVEFTEEITKMIKKVDTESLNGLMAENMRVIGKTVNSMEKVCISTLREKREKDIGKTVKEKDGKKNKIKTENI